MELKIKTSNKLTKIRKINDNPKVRKRYENEERTIEDEAETKS